MMNRKLLVCGGLTLCAMAMQTASAQNYQGWSNPAPWGYGGGMPQMPQGMPQMPQGMPQMPQGMPQMPQGMPQMAPYGSGGYMPQQAAPQRNPWSGMPMPYEPGYQRGTGQYGMSGMSGMQGQEGVSGMSGMQGITYMPSPYTGMYGSMGNVYSPYYRQYHVYGMGGFFNEQPTIEIYSISLHDALPIC